MSIENIIGSNLRKPEGFIGKVMGKIMNRGNDLINQYAIELLEIKKGDSILEIGFGNGKYIPELVLMTKGGMVTGIDYSETMVEEAIKRNSAFVKQGLVDLRLAEISKMPFEDGSFHKMFTVNTIYFWPEPQKDIQEVKRILQPGGKLVVAFRSKEKMTNLGFTKKGFSLYNPEDVVKLLSDAGFKEVKLFSREDKTLDAHCVVAIK